MTQKQPSKQSPFCLLVRLEVLCKLRGQCVSLSCYKKLYQIGGLISHSSEAGSPTPVCQHGQILLKVFLQVAHCQLLIVSPQGRDQRALRVPFIRT